MRRLAVLLSMTAILTALALSPSVQARTQTERLCPTRLTPDPSAEVLTFGVKCREANKVLHDFFEKAQTHGTPITVDRFRCDSADSTPTEEPTIVCKRGRQVVEYVGGL